MRKASENQFAMNEATLTENTTEALSEIRISIENKTKTKQNQNLFITQSSI